MPESLKMKSKPSERSKSRSNRGPAKGGFRYVEGVIPRGRLLLPDRQATEGAERAIPLALELLGRDLSALRPEDFGRRIEAIATQYWHKRQWNDRVKPAGIKKSIGPILKATERLRYLLRSSPDYRDLIKVHRSHPWPSARDQASDLSRLEAALDVLATACQDSLEAKGRRGSPEKSHIKMAVDALVQLWVDATGEAFMRSYETGEGENGVQEFVSHSPRFVQFVLQAIDEEVTLAEVRTALKSPSRSTESQSEKASKTVEFPD